VVAVKLRRVCIISLAPFFRITCGEQEMDSRDQFSPKSYKNEAYIEWVGIKNAKVKGDVLVEVYNLTLLKKKVNS